MEQQLNSSTGGWIGDDRRDEADFLPDASIEQNPMLGDALGDLLSLHESTMFEMQKKIWKDFDNHLRNYVTKNLKELGYEFISETDFIVFIQKRVTIISFECKPNEFEIYLDFVDYENRGTLIGIYSDKVDFSCDGNTVKATIGRSIA